jgi:hypothetical protein
MVDSRVDEWDSNLRNKTGTKLNVAMIYSRELENLIRKSPESGIRKIVETYEQALDDAHDDTEISRGYLEALVGGPSEEIPCAIYNAVGSVYPELDREMKDRALEKIFEILDDFRYDIVQETHTSGIREPLLVSDISIVSPLYWPGLDEGKHILKKYQNFQDLKKDLIDENGLFFHSSLKTDTKQLIDEWIPEEKLNFVRSDFVIAYSLLRSDRSNFGEEYTIVADSHFLDRTMQAIVALRFGWLEPTDIEKGRRRLEEILPRPLHQKIEPLRIRRDWVDPKKIHR